MRRVGGSPTRCRITDDLAFAPTAAFVDRRFLMLKHYLSLPSSIYVLCIGTFVNRAGTFVLSFMMLYLVDELHVDVPFATKAMGAAGVGSLLAGLIGGHLADKFGRRPVMIGALVGGAAIAASFNFLAGKWEFLFALFAFNLITDMYRPAAMAMIADTVEPARRPHAFALMYVAVNLGFAVAPIVGGWLAEKSFHWLFWGDAGTTLLYAGLIFVMIRETLPPRSANSGASGESQTLDQVGDNSASQSGRLIDAIRHIVSDAAFVRFALGIFLVSVVFMQSWSTLPLYISDKGFSKLEFGRIIAVNGMLIVLVQLPLSLMIVRFPRVPVLVISALLTGTGFGMNHFAVTGIHFVLTVILWTLGEIIQAPLMPAIVGELAPVHMRARYMGVINMAFALANALGAPIGGEVFARLGPQYVWGGSVVIGILAAACFVSIRKQLARSHLHQQKPAL